MQEDRKRKIRKEIEGENKDGEKIEMGRLKKRNCIGQKEP
jgi:hypothetical protein